MSQGQNGAGIFGRLAGLHHHLSLQKWGEREKSCRNRSWQGAQTPLCIPRPCPASHTSRHSHPSATKEFNQIIP